MRSDMVRVINERRRHRDYCIKAPKGDKKKKIWEKNNEVESKSESMCKKWKVACQEKRSHEKLGPLYRYLVSKIGCNWDEVYSEICKWHLQDRIYNLVVVNCFEENGQLYDAQYPNHPLSGNYLYVLNGILYKTPQEKRRRWSKQPPRFTAGICPLRYNGIWYEVILVILEETIGETGVKDQFLGQVADGEGFKLEKLYGSRLRCIKKRQMNSKEIEKIT